MREKSGRLWEKGLPLNEEMHRLTVGNDPELDASLVEWDCLGSAAHARMLGKIGILLPDEVKGLCAALYEIRELGSVNKFPIPHELEDVHTAIEASLIERLGEAGRKIHTGRSRNDQIVLAMRLYLRNQVVELVQLLLDVVGGFIGRFSQIGDVFMPGYTHLQPAMPSSVGMWLHAYIEGGLDQAREGFVILNNTLDENPLGAAAGFGSGLALDRAYVADLLGFWRVQRSFIDVQNSRGRKEEHVLHWLAQTASVFEKFAWDVLLFASSEFGYFSLPAELTTGSSIMPQKRNLDICELLRGKAARIRGALGELGHVTAKLPCSYHRDLQYTKEPVMRGIGEERAVLRMAGLIIDGLQVNKERLEKSRYPELFATYEAYSRVCKGAAFRDAYRETADAVKDGKIDPSTLKAFYARVVDETRSGLEAAAAEHAELVTRIVTEQNRLRTVEKKVFEA